MKRKKYRDFSNENRKMQTFASRSPVLQNPNDMDPVNVPCRTVKTK